MYTEAVTTQRILRGGLGFDRGVRCGARKTATASTVELTGLPPRVRGGFAGRGDFCLLGNDRKEVRPRCKLPGLVRKNCTEFVKGIHVLNPEPSKPPSCANLPSCLPRRTTTESYFPRAPQLISSFSQIHADLRFNPQTLHVSLSNQHFIRGAARCFRCPRAELTGLRGSALMFRGV